MTRILFGTALAICLALPLAPARAADSWPAFLNGGSSQTEAEGLPTSWGPDRNIAWRATIPGYGQSSPVIWNGTVFVTSSDGPWQERGMVHAFDLASGARRWTTELPATSKVESYFRNSRAAPTPVVDGDRVVAFFPGGDVTALDHAGKILWKLPLFEALGEPDNERGTAGSLAQSRDLVFLVVDHAGPSHAVAIRKSDGTIAWKAERGEREPSWSSPLVVRQGERELLVISSSGTVDAYDTQSGALAWQAAGFEGNLIPSATAVDGSLFVGSTKGFHGSGADDARIAASNARIDLKAAAKDTPPFEIRWGADRANVYYSSPLAFAGYVYYVNKSGVLYAIDADSGERVFTERLGGPCWATAIGVTDEQGEQRVYFFLKDGESVVLRPGDSYDELSRNRLWDEKQLDAAAELARTQRQANALPPGEAPPKSGAEQQLAGMPEAQLHRIFSYGDPIVYAAAVVDGSLLIRTGQQLHAIRGQLP